MTVELTLLSRVTYRDQEITGPRLRGLLALLAGDLRTGCSTARLVEGLWPDEQSERRCCICCERAPSGRLSP